jgi:hypothetical protein
LDRWIVTLQAPLPLHGIAAQAHRAGQRGLHERIGIVRAKARGVDGQADRLSVSGSSGPANPAWVTTPHVGGRDHVVEASTRVIGRLPHRLRVAKSSSRSMYSRSG